MLAENAVSMQKQTRFVILYFVALGISFSPFKALGQVVALFFLAGLVFFVGVRPKQHIFKYTILLVGYASWGLLYYVLLPEFSFINHFVFLVTISSVLIVFYDLRSIVDERLIIKISSVTFAFLVFEALYGIMQGVVTALRTGSFDIASGDHVRGTIEPSLRATAGLGGNVIFAILISGLFVFVIATSRLRFSARRNVFYIIILISWLISSVLHTIIFMGGAVVLALFLVKIPAKNRSMHKLRNNLIAAILFVAIMVPIVMPRNLRTLPAYLSFVFDIRQNAYSEKSRSTYYTLFELPQEVGWQPFIGVGPGQYSSRASLIRTGEYIRGTSVPLPPYTSTATEHIMTLWRNVLRRPGHGSTYFPFYSWQSLYGEMGILGVLVVGLFAFKILGNLRKWGRGNFPGMNLSLMVLTLYLLLLGFQDNYWEFTQAVFPLFLVLALGYNYLRIQNTARRVRDDARLVDVPASS